MKNCYLLFVLATIISICAHAATCIPPVDSMNPITGLTQKHPGLSVQESLRLAQMKTFVALNASDYGKLKGRKLNLFERITFKTSQHRMNKMISLYKDGYGPTTLQKISWLVKGLLLGPIALILGYLLLRDDDRELIKWIWFGFAGFVAIVALILLAA